MVKFQNGIEAGCFIFDFDGIIVDTEPLHYQAFQKVLEPLDSGFSWQEYVDTYMGFDDRDAFIEAFSTQGKGLTTQELHTLIDRKANIFQDIIRSGIAPYPGVVALIRKLRAHRIPIAISSGALRCDIDPILGTLGISDCFEVIVTADDVSKSKPDPESYRLAFEKLKARNPAGALTPARTIAIEDTPAGISSARGAGLQVVAVTNSYPREYLTQATCIVPSLEELLDSSFP
ncbi:HAD family phosphatase [Geobacter sp. SVR]|uniref:HAD family hydrolase n=1 Tax=Geobacter sp. SVR TaxID=2495594 RepID=UPI00143EF819|nr:HAD family phosphatase [Geobacter sp. SVR]BCS53538.1 haloacid dehalogenase [Geobacter sp. SVR]GCF84265.1 haloacid dehalogenase [Geobacter sp. SVR]